MPNPSDMGEVYQTTRKPRVRPLRSSGMLRPWQSRPEPLGWAPARGRVLEHPTAEPVARERDGGTTTIRFRIDGEPAELYFPARRLDDGSERQSTITLPDGTLNLTRLSDVSPSQELPAGVTYICHDQAY